jgi:hypothetical protein
MAIPKTREHPPAEEPPSFRARVERLGARICELKAATERQAALFREALREFATHWLREAAKKVAVSQHAVTLGLGETRIAALKREIEERVRGLEDVIAREFAPARALDTQAASSGQVAALIHRRFEEGVRRVLAVLGPLLEKAGYARDEHWVEAEPAEGGRPRFAGALDLPPDLRELMEKIAEAITEQKVAEAKIAYYDKQSEKELAAELWERA